MALLTLGTNATTSLSALKFLPGQGTMNPQDVGTLSNMIRGQNAVQARTNAYFSSDGLLRIPGGRGVLQVLPGDYVGVDATTGWPVLISAYAIANGPYTHS